MKNIHITKKIVAVALALLLSLSLFACGEESASESATDAVESDAAENSSSDQNTIPYDTDADIAPEVEEIPIPEISQKKVSELTVEEIQDAIVQCALAYYYKNPYVQYDLGNLSVYTKNDMRRTGDFSPENISWDQMCYAQCSQYIFDIIYEAFGYEFLGDTKHSGFRLLNPNLINNKNLYWESVVAFYDADYGAQNDGMTREELKDYLEYEAQPGDVYCGGGYEVTGHVMIIVGDVDGDGKNDVMHCWPQGGGSLTNASTEENNTVDSLATDGDQKWEADGAILLQSVEDLLLTEGSKPNWGILTQKNDQYGYVYRVRNISAVQELSITPATATRMEYKRIDICKTFNETRYDSLAYGETFTITETITNHSDQAYESLEVVEYVPQGAVLVSADENATIDGKKLKWTVNVPAQETVTITYTMRNYTKAGETLELIAGRVGSIPTKTFSIQIDASTFSEEQMAIWNSLAYDGKIPDCLKVSGYYDLDFANVLYRELFGVELNLPTTVSDFLTTQYEAKSIRTAGATMLQVKEGEENSAIAQMTLKDQTGGFYFYNGERPDTYVHNSRMYDIQEGYYQPGDIFIAISGNSTTSVRQTTDISVFIYVGNGRVIWNATTGVGFAKFEKSVELLMKSNFVTVLRPSLWLTGLGD